jgi:hypothetical protein
MLKTKIFQACLFTLTVYQVGRAATEFDPGIIAKNRKIAQTHTTQSTKKTAKNYKKMLRTRVERTSL